MFEVTGQIQGGVACVLLISLNRCSKLCGLGEGQWVGEGVGEHNLENILRPARFLLLRWPPRPTLLGSTTWWEIAACHFFGCESKILVP